jgi:hypothetical protein
MMNDGEKRWPIFFLYDYTSWKEENVKYQNIEIVFVTFFVNIRTKIPRAMASSLRFSSYKTSLRYINFPTTTNDSISLWPSKFIVSQSK